MAGTDHDPWADRADDIRRSGHLELVEVWQARATKAEARVAALETAIVRAASFLRDDMPRTALNILESAHA
jgi:hypothetical protein